MKQHSLFPFLFILFVCFSFQLQAQMAILHDGYIINRDGERIDCQIKEDTYNNYAHQVTYLLPGESELKTAFANSLLGFGIPATRIHYVTHEMTDYERNYKNDLVQVKAKKFLKLLEDGAIRLYEYYSKGLKKNILFLQKDYNPIQRLDIYRLNYLDGKVNSVDTLYKSKSVEDKKGLYTLQKNYMTVLSKYTNNCNRITLDQNTELNKKQMETIVRAYNSCFRNAPPAQTNFIARNGSRLQIITRMISLQGLQEFVPTIGLELQLGLDPTRTTAITYGILRSLQQKPISTYNDGNNDTSTSVTLHYLRINSYFSPGSRLRPYAFIGTDYYRSSEKNGASHFLNFQIAYGGGVLYQIKGGTFVTFEAQSLLSPDFQLGIGVNL